jgi:hypothetical protein
VNIASEKLTKINFLLNRDNMMEDNEFMDRNYGSTTAASGSNKGKKTASVTYCVHGKLAGDCCELDSLKIKTIQDGEFIHSFSCYL